MAAPGRRTDPDLNEQLFAAGHRFSFLQVVRLLRRLRPPRALGGEPLADDPARFRAHVSLEFPAAEVQRVTAPAKPGGLSEVVVNFLGLIGPLGVLPRHYTQLALLQLRDRNPALVDFLDMFTHRVVALFARAWEKYHLPSQYERMVLEGRTPSGRAMPAPHALHLYQLMGLSSGLLRRRLGVRDHALLFYVGLMAQQPRSAAALRGVLTEYFEVAVEVRQFQGRWLALDLDARTAIGRTARNDVLGDTALVGDRVWDQQAKFRLRFGPLGYDAFCRLLPSGSAFAAVVALTRLFVGQEHDFDIQLVLRAADVPPCRLGAGGERAPRLGWSAFLLVRPAEQDSDAVVLRGSETMVGAFPDGERASVARAA